MLDTPVQCALDEVLAPRLVALGWKRRGSRGFLQRHGSTAWVIRIQHGDYYKKHGACRLTVRVMRIKFLPFASRKGIEPCLRSPQLWRDRSWEDPILLRLARRTMRPLGELTEVRELFWYSYDADNPADCLRVAGEVTDDIETYAMPWFTRLFWRAPRRVKGRKASEQARYDTLRAERG
ncbi:hypothetical protein [Novosphingobium sp.]|uniref:hypothetical protein n=1 Tax=Novosphingobium sp. TaxID=1874826 RepID=UPI0027359264|nr:hypothetical protein [Novosphingobium sp.]MDP3906686.1 hypothetical protein [Novosphingobium sp.]